MTYLDISTIIDNKAVRCPLGREFIVRSESVTAKTTFDQLIVDATEGLWLIEAIGIETPGALVPRVVLWSPDPLPMMDPIDPNVKGPIDPINTIIANLSAKERTVWPNERVVLKGALYGLPLGVAGECPPEGFPFSAKFRIAAE